jgi:NAD(P)-dependent dehydrogenase (short-subunit alcohol dehydrogenase family)
MKQPVITTSLKGKTVVVTGASAGIGESAAQTFHELGATVIVVGRSPERTRAVANKIGATAVIADFAILSDVRRAAVEILDVAPRIDILANNAGGSWPGRSETIDGHEMMFQVNYLAPFLLTMLLRPALATAHGRVINTSSLANRTGSLNLKDLEMKKKTRGLKNYGTTKLENILHAREIARQWAGDGITAASFHPGIVATEFGRNDTLTGIFYRSTARFMKTSSEGADTLIWLATAKVGEEFENGGYYDNRRPGALNSQARPGPATDALAAELWARSEAIITTV